MLGYHLFINLSTDSDDNYRLPGILINFMDSTQFLLPEDSHYLSMGSRTPERSTEKTGMLNNL